MAQNRELEEIIRDVIQEELPGFTGSVFIIESNMQYVDGAKIVFGKSVGTQIGTEADQKIAFFGATPVAQQSSITKVSEEANVDTTTDEEIEEIGDTSFSDQSAVIERNILEVRDTQNEIIDVLKNYGLIA